MSTAVLLDQPITGSVNSVGPASVEACIPIKRHTGTGVFAVEVALLQGIHIWLEDSSSDMDIRELHWSYINMIYYDIFI